MIKRKELLISKKEVESRIRPLGKEEKVISLLVISH